MSVHLFSIHIIELDGRIEGMFLLHLEMAELGEAAWTKDEVQFQKEHDKLQK